MIFVLHLQNKNTMDKNNITTAFTLDGYRITKNLGIVRGITVRSRSVFGTIGASFQTLVGGNISIYTELCEKAREEAFDILAVHAEQIGANAIIGMRYDANEVAQGVTEVLAYGTAVVVEKV
jgi:uncharacterized protein YbjQ (UPF0145 family)